MEVLQVSCSAKEHPCPCLQLYGTSLSLIRASKSPGAYPRSMFAIGVLYAKHALFSISLPRARNCSSFTPYMSSVNSLYLARLSCTRCMNMKEPDASPHRIVLRAEMQPAHLLHLHGSNPPCAEKVTCPIESMHQKEFPNMLAPFSVFPPSIETVFSCAILEFAEEEARL